MVTVAVLGSVTSVVSVVMAVSVTVKSSSPSASLSSFTVMVTSRASDSPSCQVSWAMTAV